VKEVSGRGEVVKGGREKAVEELLEQL